MLDQDIRHPNISTISRSQTSSARLRPRDQSCFNARNYQIPKMNTLLSACLIASMLLDSAHAQSESYLDGIGYREQELQVAKGSFFQSEDPSGVNYASFAGGTHIFIKGVGLAENPQSNYVLLKSVTAEFGDATIQAPLLTEDDAFNSHTILGSIAYRLPAIDKLFGLPMNYFDAFQTLTFEVSIIANTDLGAVTLECQTASNCRVSFRKTHTPVVYYISPPIVYYDSETEVWFDPKNTNQLIQDLSSDEMMFINAKVGGSLLDFEFNVDDATTYSSYYRNYARGKVGELPIGESYDIKMQWETGQAYVLRQESTHCSYDNQTCYQARAVPVIHETSSNTGYTSGGQNLTISGFGFDKGDISAKVDGQDCIVTSQSLYSFSCEVSPKAEVSISDSNYAGSHGMRRGFINEANWLNFETIESEGYETSQKLSLTMQAPHNEADMSGNIYKGWFVAPATTNYRFYMTCDDYCSLHIGTNSMDSADTTEILRNIGNVDHRDWWEAKRPWQNRISEWISLTEGEHYFLKGNHLEGSGGDHFSVAVEIEQADTAGHHHAMKEVQYLSVSTDQIFDTTRINITNADDGEFILAFQNPNDQSLFKSEPISASATAEQFRAAIEKYYQDTDFMRSNIFTNRTWYDETGAETEDESLAVQSVYYITVRKLISGPSVSNILVIKTSTTATITVDLPQVVGLSATPLSGSYRIKCVAADGTESYSLDIGIAYGENWANNNMHNGCDRIYDLTEMYNGNDFDYLENGRSFILRFIGLNEDPGQFEIVQSETNPLTAGEEGTITFFANTTVPYGQNLFFEPIPFEMLRTYETEPQLIVTVDNLPAVCHNLTCDFTYIQPVGEVTAFTFDQSTSKLVLTGTDMPSLIGDIDKVEFALSKCTIDESTISATNLECTLVQEPTCGDHLPILTSNLGVIPNFAGAAAQTINCEVSSVVPNTDLNLLGGDNITISGLSLPHNFDTSTVSIKFSDAQETICTPQFSTTSDLVCLTEAFDSGVSAGQTLSMVVVINGQTVSNSLSVTMKSDVKTSTTITPSSASPVLKTRITVQLQSDFPFTLERGDFSINATSTTNSSYVRYLNVVEVDDSAKTLVALFGGAESGTFQISIRHKEYGLVGTDGLILDVSSSVTSFTPNTGSIYGGTLLTITGTNFGTVATDNPVQISNNGGVGSINCYVQETSATEIKCRIETDLNKVGGDADTMIVFLKTSEEAVCDPLSKCEFTWTNTLPTITATNLDWNTASNQWNLRVTGTGFTGDETTTELIIDNVAQTTTSISSTEVIFTITDVSSQTLGSRKVFFDVGIPEGHHYTQAAFTLTPKLVSVSPNSGSIGGSLITAVVQGAGESTDIVDSSGASICESVQLKSYGVIECKTLPQAIPATQLSVKDADQTYDCANSDTTLCQYEQLESAGFPMVTSSDSSGDSSVVFTGTNFDITDFTASATFAGISADSVVIDSATQATASFNLGVPFANESPVLTFTKDQVIHYAPSASSVTQELSVTSSSSGFECSFAGGCEFEVTSTGLASILKGDSASNYISVCDEKCIFDETISSATLAKCNVPKLSTVYSNLNFKISSESENLKSGNYFGTAEDYEIVFDNHLLKKPTDTSATCFVGMQFKENHVGLLSQVKYFMKDISSKDIFVNTTTFQGSNDGSSYTDLFQLDENLHEGWNYFKWEDTADQPKYRFYRFYAEAQGACAINEIAFTGVETIDDDQNTHTCSAKLVVGDTETSLNDVVYKGSLTPFLSAISPRFGTVVGGTEVTFTGTDFTSDTSLYSIIIDGIDCPVSSADTTSVTCTTGSRPGLVESSLEIKIDGKGLVSNNDMLFRYVSVWSSDTTWGGEFAPMYDETIYIPKGLNLLVDVDSTPILNAVLVEGSLIFPPDSDPNHHRTFDAHYIFVNGGLLEVGTEEFPYTSKITITMHSASTDPYLPIYGNKVIGVRYGTLDMHGPVRTPTWTMLETTAVSGSTTITLQEAVDWQVGEEIAIASTSFESRDAERRIIAAIDSTMKIITLDKALDHQHFAETQTFGDETIDMRAEVGLLSRNVVFRGDPETSRANEYGATIFLHSSGDDSLTCRLSYIECADCGQAFKVGRYSIHFHMIGAVHNSYAKGLAINRGFNRAFTLHGTHYLRLTENVAFEVKGHTVFIEDAIETNNYIYKNLIMKTMRSMSLLNTDQTPACFWITHPNNIFIDNHAAGSDRYGYWYDLQTHSTGPSADTDICPENDKVGEFRGNTAHSMGRYGLRIFHNMVPREKPCKPIVFDVNVPDDPYWQNRPITANFDDFTGWKCKRNGAIAERVGDVHFNNFKTADNILAGIEFSLTAEYGDGYAQINGALVVGKTANTEDDLEWSSPRGIITPRTENFQVKNVKFFNYNWNEAAGLGSCSHCFHPAATDSGSRTVTFSGLTFDNSVYRRIMYQYPHKAIYYDLDGTLTEKGPKSWAASYFQHLEQPECEYLNYKYNGVTCTPEVQIRRVAFWNTLPNGLMNGMGMKFLKYDDDIIGAMDNDTFNAYIENRDNYGTVKFKPKQDPLNGWATPFVTGHKYKFHFGLTGLDFEQVTLTMSQRWEDTDLPIYFVHNFTDVREAVEVRLNGNLIENNTIPSSTSEYEAGQNLILNDTETREVHLIVNGFNQSANPLEESNLVLTGIRCVASCNEDIVEVETESEFRYWSDVTNWPDETLPVEGDDVHILSGWNMILDIEETPVFKLIRVNGVLSFSDEMDVHLKAKHIFVRAGELHIGNETHPYNHTAKITLYGEKDAEAIVYDNAIEAGNKVLANVGTVKMFGQSRTTKMTRLHQEANKGDTEIYVDKDLDLVEGDRIALAATSYKQEAGEYFTISSYDSVSGKIVLTEEVHYNHWGAPESTSETYNGVDIRGEVLILSRNIQISGEDIESWGCQMVTSDTLEFDQTTLELKERTGQMILDNVEMYNCSQIDTFKASIRFENAVTLHSSVSNSAFHNGWGWGANIKNSANIHMQNNLWFNYRAIGVSIDFSNNITFDNNVIAHVLERETLEAGDNFVDKRAGLTVCQYHAPESCTDITVTNNIAAGVTYAGFIAPGHDCGDYTSNAFKNNIAHSVAGFKGGHGALIYPDPTRPSHKTCYEGSYFTAYKCYYQGAYAFYSSQSVIFSNMNMIDNRQGFGACLKVVGDPEYKEIRIELNDNKIYGETPISDCPEDGSFCKRYDKFGVILSGAAHKGKEPHITGESSLPVHKIKGLASWGTVQKMHRNQFIGFDSKTSLGKRQVVFEINEYQPDYLPMMEFFDSSFIDVKEGAAAFIMDPKPGWANLDDCGNYPCTAPQNALLSFQDTTFTGVKPRWAASDFQIIANNSAFSPYIETCQPQASMNAYVCEAEKMGILLFESLDEDRQDRSMQPIYVKKQGTGMENNLNAMMDHVWDGFYTGQIRLQRFPSVFQGERGSIYDLNFTGSPAKHMQFTLRSQSKTTGSTIRIAYPGSESRAIYVDGELIQMNQWDDSIQQYGDVKQRFCGENRYIGVKNILEFYINTDCKLEIKPRNAIQTTVRMEWTMEEFFSDGGTTQFVDRLTASLGIHASTVKIVSVYEGSLIINYEISVDDDDENALNAIAENQQAMFESGAVDLGAPILAFETAVQINSDTSSSSYTPVTISTPAYDNSNKNEASEFNPDLAIITEQQISYKNTSVQVELSPKTVYKTEITIIVDSPKEQDPIQIKDESDKQGSLIIMIAISALVVVILLYCTRYLFLKKTQEKLDVQRDIQKIQEREKAQEMSNVKEFHTQGKMIPDEHELQYDPNNDFAIFGVGDKAMGGLQDMKEKMNLADNPQDDESSEEEEDQQKSSGVGGSGSGSSGEIKHHLPEDKEIHSESD